MRPGEYHDIFLERVKAKFGDLYDYRETKYGNRNTKVRLICREHGAFYRFPHELYRGCGCPKCGNARKGRWHDDTMSFVKKVRDKFGECQGIDLSLVEYKDRLTKVEIVCERHGHVRRSPRQILSSKFVCPECGREHARQANNRKRIEAEKRRTIKPSSGTHREVRDLESFVRKAKEIHGDKYDYSQVQYVDTQTKVAIICPKHGVFYMKPNKHTSWRKSGCPVCNESRLENTISVMLEKKGIPYVREKNFTWLGRMRLDFYLPKHRIAIECQGVQHYRPVARFGGTKGYEITKRRDAEKRMRLAQHKIKLFYYDDKGWLTSSGQRTAVGPF